MGSLASRPKVPTYTASPQVVYVPAPSTSVTASATTSATSGSSAGSTTQNTASSGTDTTQTTSEVTKEVREDNLLRRSRGRLSTVLTGFKGILSDTANTATSSQRKSLLGE